MLSSHIRAAIVSQQLRWIAKLLKNSKLMDIFLGRMDKSCEICVFNILKQYY